MVFTKYYKHPIECLLDAVSERLLISKNMGGEYLVRYDHCDIKIGPSLQHTCGIGKNVFEAAMSYIDAISGKTLVFHAESPTARKEVHFAILIIDNARTEALEEGWRCKDET